MLDGRVDGGEVEAIHPGRSAYTLYSLDVMAKFPDQDIQNRVMPPGQPPLVKSCRAATKDSVGWGSTKITCSINPHFPSP